MAVAGEVYAGTGASGTTDGNRLTTARFSNLEGLAWARDFSKLFVSDYGNGRIRVVNPDTNLVSTLVTGLDRCEAIETAPDGTLWLGHVGPGQIEQVNTTTGARTVRASGLTRGNNPRISPDGAFVYFVVDTKTIYRMPYPTGALSVVKGGIFAQIEEMFFSPVSGLLYVADFAAGEVIELDVSTGAYSVVLTGLGSTNGVTVDDAGIVYASSRTSGRITSYNPADGSSSAFFSDLDVPNSVDVGPDGNLYVADYAARQVVRIVPQRGGWSIGKVRIG